MNVQIARIRINKKKEGGDQMSIIKQIDKLEKIINDVKFDAEKFDGGGKGSNSAGTRVRVAMQELKSIALDIRKSVQEMKTK